MQSIKQRQIATFGCRKSRGFTAKQKELMQSLLPQTQLQVEGDSNALLQYDNVSLEIGCGGGKMLSSLAQCNPQNLYIGAETYLNGVAQLLSKIQNLRISNIRIWSDDARLLLQKLNYETLNNVYVICPDPWPKQKHAKRRIITIEVLGLVYDKLKKNGKIFIATDHDIYASWIMKMLKIVENQSLYTVNYKLLINKTMCLEEGVLSHYMEKALLKNKAIHFYTVQKIVS